MTVDNHNLPINLLIWSNHFFFNNYCLCYLPFFAAQVCFKLIEQFLQLISVWFVGIWIYSVL